MRRGRLGVNGSGSEGGGCRRNIEAKGPVTDAARRRSDREGHRGVEAEVAGGRHRAAAKGADAQAGVRGRRRQGGSPPCYRELRKPTRPLAVEADTAAGCAPDFRGQWIWRAGRDGAGAALGKKNEGRRPDWWVWGRNGIEEVADYV
jgi:hypothetical protein